MTPRLREQVTDPDGAGGEGHFKWHVDPRSSSVSSFALIGGRASPERAARVFDGRRSAFYSVVSSDYGVTWSVGIWGFWMVSSRIS